MPDKLLNTLKIQSSLIPLIDPSPSRTSAQFNTSNKNISVFNPEDDNSYLQQNDQLFKIINFDNGNAVKDCKALLDMMKEQFLQEKQKLNLFYQPDLNELLQGLKINDLNVKKTILNKAGQQIQSKIKNLKIKRRNQVFNNYSKLMKYSLSQNQRISFIKQSSKITQVRCPSSQSSNLANDLRSSQTILQKMMKQKRNKIAIQNSSKTNQEQFFNQKRMKQLQGIMKNRGTCEKILQEALMFQRYYHIMKKQKLKVLSGQNNGRSKGVDTGLGSKRIKTEAATNGSSNKNNGKNLNFSQSLNKRPRTTMRNHTNSSVVKYTTTQKKNDMCMDPRHLRLPEYSQQQKQSSSLLSKTQMSEEDYYRQKFMVGLKRDEYLRQINKVNQQIVQKKNMRNNCLISNVLGLIRQNTIGNQNQNNENISLKKEEKKIASRKGSRQREYNQSINEKGSEKYVNEIKNVEKVKPLSGSQLTKILRRLFLIYSSGHSNNGSNNDDNNTKDNSNKNEARKQQNKEQILITLSPQNESLSLMSSKSLRQFFRDFQLEQYLAGNNEKMDQILQRDHIDQFQFIQLVHLLSAVIHQAQFNVVGQSNQGMIYTNINFWISKKILDKKYVHLLEIKQFTLLDKLQRDLIRLRKYFRLQDIIHASIQDFIHIERINKIKAKTIFQDFDYVLQTLWSMKIYPQYINKNSLRFYFEYLKQEKYSFIINSTSIRVKIKQNIIVQNIIWLAVANMTINDQRITDYQQIQKTEITKEKMTQKVFTQKFKLIIKSITNTTENDDNTKNYNLSDNNSELTLQ